MPCQAGGTRPEPPRRRLDLLCAAGQRPAAQHPQHLGVAPLLAPAARRELPAHHPPRGRQPAQHVGDDRDAEAEPGRGRRPRRRAVGARVAGDQVAQRIGRPARGTPAGTPTGSGTPSASRSRPASSIAAHRSCPATRTVIARRECRQRGQPRRRRPSRSVHVLGHREVAEQRSRSASVLGVARPPVQPAASCNRARCRRSPPGRAARAVRPGRAARPAGSCRAQSAWARRSASGASPS